MGKIAQESTQLEILKSLRRASKSLPSTNASVDITSTKVINANKNRSSLVLTNTGSYPVFLGLGETAVANQGIYLVASGGVWIMDYFTYTNKMINAISVGGATNISIQEFE